MTVFYTALPILLAAFGNSKRWSRTRLVLLGMLSVVAISGCVLHASESGYRRVKAALFAYDTDGNGSFSKDEFVPEARRIMDAYTSDTGRGMGPIIKGLLAAIYTVSCFRTIGFLFTMRIARKEALAEP
mgnify:CR=1 FL=1